MLKRPLLLLLFLLFCLKGFSAVFVVTSNADTGPGTLRDALTQAAANGQANTINFNLADTTMAGRTITISTNLPQVSPNLVIDGTTQTGSSFGVTNTKIKIVNTYIAVPADSIYIFKGTNAGNFTVIGIWMLAGYQGDYQDAASIFFVKSNTITVTNCLIQIGQLEIDSCQSFIFKSNIMGFLQDGISPQRGDINVINTENVTIGGETVADGNLVSGLLMITNNNLLNTWTFNISNNKLGSDYTGLSSSVGLYDFNGRIFIYSGNGEIPNLGSLQGKITNNLVENFGATGIYVLGKGNVTITGNCLNTDKTGTINFRNFEPPGISEGSGACETGIGLADSVHAIIGGSNPGDPNILGNMCNGILEVSAGQVTISQNSIFCIGQNFNIHDFETNSHFIPTVRINPITNNTISGIATPGARVELFSNIEGTCPTCDPRHFFAFVTADSQGNWQYTGAVPPNVVASAIFDNQTSRFTKALIDSSNIKITQPTCGQNNGAISGISFYNTGGVNWVDQNGNTISSSIDINNLPPGKYQLQVGNGTCGAKSQWFVLLNPKPQINTLNLKVIQPACNKNGSISGITISTQLDEKLDVQWANGTSILNDTTLNISNLSPGQYMLTVTGDSTRCTSTYGPIILKSTTGPNIDQSHIKVQSTNCGQSTGSITNIPATGTGTLTYNWTNSSQQTVSTDSILVNQPAGTYTLHVTDNTQCGPVYASAISIPETNGIIMDESKATTSPASCGKNNGSVTGIQVSGATQYQWTNASNNVVSTNADLQNVPAGTYTLTASNSLGCSKTSQAYTVPEQAVTKFPDYAATYIAACNALNNGGVSVAVDQLVKSERWVDASGNTIATAASLSNVYAGTYQLYLTDGNGCETFYKTYTINSYPEFTVSNYAAITNDECGLNNGAIGATTISGGIPPYVYTWHDSDNKQIATTNAITNLSAGTYILDVVDGGCGHIDITYTINSQSEDLAAPSVSNLQLCSSGNALLSVDNPVSSVIYRLYDSPSATQPIQEEKGGYFTVDVLNNHNYYISQLNGDCESSRAQLQVTVGLSTLNIANTFTPNGDGINDYWQIAGVENYPNALVQIFNRYGQKLFESKGYSTPFDGTYKGQKLASGVYYYIINLNTNCNLLSGSLTILR